MSSRTKKKIFLSLAVIGAILPSYYFVSWTDASGFSFARILELMFANPIASGIAFDAMVAALAVIIFIFIDRQELKVPYFWVSLIGIFLIGVAFALPFYLYLRESALERGNIKENEKS